MVSRPADCNKTMISDKAQKNFRRNAPNAKQAPDSSMREDEASGTAANVTAKSVKVPAISLELEI
jgi:hypothetical protein